MRISTSEVFRNGIQAIHRNQSDLARTQEQLATGRRMLSPSDDPGGAIAALQLRDGIAAIEQYARNATHVTARLELQESTLGNMSDLLQRVRELTVQAANSTQTDASRRSIAVELRQLSIQLQDIANTRAANGEYLFAGTRSDTQPFLRDGAGVVQYLGDTGQREVAISSSRKVALGDSGHALMSLPAGNGVFSVTPADDNNGTGRVTVAQATTAAAGTAAFRLELTAADQYTVFEADGAVAATGAFVPDSAIEFSGHRIVLGGAPAAGDSFDIAPAEPVSMFSMIDHLTAALETPRPSAAARAQLSHATDLALTNLDHALDRVTEIRASVGARLQTVERQQDFNDEQIVQLRTVLSSIEDLDYAEAISRFSLQQAALQAAQQTYLQLARTSLFDYLR